MAEPDTLARGMISLIGFSASSQSEPCPDCGALVPVVPDGPTHRYFGASPGCWALYTALLSREFSDFDARSHQFSVDTYAAQHPGRPSPHTTQSVCTHLVALCLSLEHGYGVEDIRPVMGGVGKGRYFEPEWLAPPALPWRVTIVDLLDTGSPHAYGEGVMEVGVGHVGALGRSARAGSHLGTTGHRRSMIRSNASGGRTIPK